MLIVLPLVAAGVAVAGMGAWVAYTSSVEKPSYRIVRADGDVEIRDYPKLVVAEVERAGERWSAVRSGFRPLARYIFAEDRPGERIAMTAPVTQEPAEPGSTGPTAARKWLVRFIMPAKHALAALPRPGGDVRLSEIESRRMAAIRFSGVATDGSIAEHEADLRRWLAQTGLPADGPATYAYYNDPLTPGFLRRNEVLIALGPAG